MSTDLVLRLKSESAHINTVGAIYPRPTEREDDPPKVTDVIARNTAGSRFVLAPGNYEYRFIVQSGSGKYTLSISYAGRKRPFTRKVFDSEVATQGLIFRFDVPARAS